MTESSSRNGVEYKSLSRLRPVLRQAGQSWGNDLASAGGAFLSEPIVKPDFYVREFKGGITS
jgi:hypothetical protein